MKFIVIMPFLILLALQASAQKGKINFSSINQIGFLSGGKGNSWMFQTINGIKKDRSFAGIGIGLDFYEERTIPVFLDIRRDLTNKKNTPFAYADGGINISWLNFVQREAKGFPKTSPGLFYDLGVGWKLAGKNNRSFLISAGYSFKQVKEKVKSVWWIAPTQQLESDNYERYNYLYRRIVIKAGFML